MRYKVHAWSLEREWTVNRIFATKEEAEEEARYWRIWPEIIRVEIEELPPKPALRLFRGKQ